MVAGASYAPNKQTGEIEMKKIYLEALAKIVNKDGNIRIGKDSNSQNKSVAFFIGPNFVVGTDTKIEMHYYLSGRADQIQQNFLEELKIGA